MSFNLCLTAIQRKLGPNLSSATSMRHDLHASALVLLLKYRIFPMLRFCGSPDTNYTVTTLELH